MNKVKTISKKKGKAKKPETSQEQENLKLLIAKNPHLKTLIEKFDLVTCNP
jgi:hypothetical protein